MTSNFYNTYYNQLTDENRDKDILVAKIFEYLKANNIKLDFSLLGGGTSLLALFMNRCDSDKYVRGAIVNPSSEYIKDDERYMSAKNAFDLATRLSGRCSSSFDDNTFKISIVAKLQDTLVDLSNKEDIKSQKLHQAYVCFMYKNKLLIKHVAFNPDLDHEDQEEQLITFVCSLLYLACEDDKFWDMIVNEDTDILWFVRHYFQDLDRPIIICLNTDMYEIHFRPSVADYKYITAYNGEQAIMEIPSREDRLVDQHRWFSIRKRTLADKLEFINFLVKNRAKNFELIGGCKHICRITSQTLGKLSEEEFGRLNSYRAWKFQIFNCEPTTEDFADVIEIELVMLDNYELISMPSELIDDFDYPRDEE